jgi:nucleoside-diphosphate kinase
MPAARRLLVEEGFHVPLAELTALGRREFQADERLPQIYSEISGLADFFMNGERGRHRAAFVEYLTRIYTGTVDADTLARHYEEHVGKGFYAELVQFMSRGPVVALALEGPENTWEVVRTMMGATNPRNAAPGTIRGDLGILFTENLVHGSDSLASAERELGIFFPNL